MSGETEQNVSGWTVDTIKAYLERRIDEKDIRDLQRFEQQQLALREALIAQEKAVNAALAAAQQAVNKAEIAAEKRFDATNEFRAQLADQAATLISRREVETIIGAINDKVADLQDRLNRGEGNVAGGNQWRAQSVALFAMLFGAVGVVAAIIVAIVK